MLHLGHSNNWKQTPDIILKCRKKDHKREINTTNNLIEYYCPECNYMYILELIK